MGKKIGIITFHSALNAGATLQAFALQHIISKFNCSVEFIDYRTKKKYHIKSFIAKTFNGTINKLRNIINGIWYDYKAEYKKCLKISSKHYFSYNELKRNPPIYDVYIAGSDQIWNFKKEIDPAYLLSFAPKGAKKIAYAASLGQCEIPIKLYPRLKEELSSFSAISIREQNGVDFVNNLLDHKLEIYLTIDPTLLLSAKTYEKIMQPNQIIYKEYICSYILNQHDNYIDKIINTLREIYDLPVINLRNPDTGIILPNATNIIVSPYKWLYYIKKSELVICGSFHAVAFAIIFHKPFIAIENNGINQRIRSLLQCLGLEERIIQTNNEDSIQNLLNKKIDWDIVNKKLDKFKEKSLNFLNKNL